MLPDDGGSAITAIQLYMDDGLGGDFVIMSDPINYSLATSMIV